MARHQLGASGLNTPEFSDQNGIQYRTKETTYKFNAMPLYCGRLDVSLMISFKTAFHLITCFFQKVGPGTTTLYEILAIQPSLIRLS